MADYLTTDTELESVANAIRAKGGTSESLSFPDGFISAIENIPTGGSQGIVITDTIDAAGGTIRTITAQEIPSGGSKDGDVIFIDYDGTIVDAKTKAQINAMTSDSDLPSNPSHNGLTAQGWNWTVTQLKAQLTAMPDQKVFVGQMYVTTSGDTEIDVVMQEGRLEPILTICVNGTITVDWGDNTTPDTVTGSSLTTRLEVGPHTYAGAGSYTIKISVVSGNFTFFCDSSYTILRKNTSVNENKLYTNCIKAIRLGTGISQIANYAFYNCFSLSDITIPNTVTSIGTYVFRNCYSLFNITIPNTVTNIGNYTFCFCNSLFSITIPSTVTSIGNNAFNFCYSLSNITIPNTVTSIGNNAFDTCSSLSNIAIPNTVTNMGIYVFNYCYSLSSITIPNTVTSIGENVFFYCYSLSNITIPNTVTSIGIYAFESCYSLSNITISNTVTSIGKYAFSYCLSLSNITIPNTVTSIGNNAFQNCCGAKEYHFQSTSVPTGGTDMFKNIPSDCIIYVPYSSDHSILNAYKTANNWSTYASYMQEEPQ